MARKGAVANGALTILGVIFLSFAIILTAIFGFIYFKTQDTIKNADTHVQGVISDITSYRDSDGDTHHRAYVTYEFEGKLYENIVLNTYSSGMKVGKEYTIYIPDASRPHSVTVDNNWIFILMMSIFGSVFGILGIVFIIASRTSNRSYLVEKGVLVYATVTYAGPSNTTINNKQTYRIKGEWTDSNGIIHKVKSPLLFYLPIHEFTEVRVFVDPDNYKKYYMDVEYEPSNIMESAF